MSTPGAIALSAARAAISRTFTALVVVQAPSVTQDALGAYSESWDVPVTVATTYGRVMQPTATEVRLLAEREIAGTGYAVAVPVGTGVLPTHRLAINGNTFWVVRALPEATDPLYLRVLVYLPF